MAHQVTLNDLLRLLRAGDDRPVAFRTPERAVRAGYHLTEFKLARVRSVDCGRGGHEWNEAIVELLDGNGRGAPMRAGKLSAIMDEVVSRFPEMGDSSLVVEFGPDGLSRYRVEMAGPADSTMASQTDEWLVSLAPVLGQCKASLRPGCCGHESVATTPSCCTSV